MAQKTINDIRVSLLIVPQTGLDRVTGDIAKALFDECHFKCHGDIL